MSVGMEFPVRQKTIDAAQNASSFTSLSVLCQVGECGGGTGQPPIGVKKF
jgi:hypothetical protein